MKIGKFTAVSMACSALMAGFLTVTDGGAPKKAEAFTWQQCMMFRLICERKHGNYTPGYFSCIPYTCPIR